MHKWWISSIHRGTGLVETTSIYPLVITFTPPIWRKFRGQVLNNLTRWLTGDGLIIEEL